MPPDLEDRALQNLDHELLLEVYRYSYGRLELKHKKRWALIEKFHEQFLDWVEKEEEDTQGDVLESSQLVLREILLFRLTSSTSKIAWSNVFRLRKEARYRWRL